MKIAMATAEALPFAKTGGLADVCAALPAELARLGHAVSVFLPAYRSTLKRGLPIEPSHVGFTVLIDNRRVSCRVLQCQLPDSNVVFYLIDQPQYFDRDGLYGDAQGDYPDNCERFSFFGQSVVHAIQALQLKPDIMHCHDWQAGLIPAYVKTNFDNLDWMQSAGVVTTIHNLAYQGRFGQHDMKYTRLDWSHFNWRELEFYGDLCFLKSAIVFADRVTTVSPTYAQEIQTPEHGCGLDSVLSARANQLSGIVNGVDYAAWDPKHDEQLVSKYSLNNWQEGKAASKKALQQELGLEPNANAFVIGLVGRLAYQKGWELVIPLIERTLGRPGIQWAILGSGESRFESALQNLAQREPHRIGVQLKFSEPLAHRIEAGSDLFLMPSIYEPCGLNQLYSLRYGTLPLVHRTGGLADTVTDATEGNLEMGTATGFQFTDYSIDGLDARLCECVELFYHRRDQWNAMVVRGMQQDWSWDQSANQYVEIFESLHSKLTQV